MELIKIDKDNRKLVLEQLKEAAIWLKDHDIDYWQNWHNPSDLHKNWIKEGLKKEQFYGVYEDAQLIGIFRLQYNDELFWCKRNDKAGYVHSFTTNLKMSGQGVGYRILDKITELLQENGSDYLRLDCGIENTKLIKFYKKYGFEEAGEAFVYQERLVLLQKRI